MPLAVLAEDEGVARAVGDRGDPDAAIVVDHAVELAEDRGRHQVGEAEGERARVAGVAGEGLEPRAGGQRIGGSADLGIMLKLHPGVTPVESSVGGRTIDLVLDVARADQGVDLDAADRQVRDV